MGSMQERRSWEPEGDDNIHFLRSYHSGCVNALFADGSVRTYRALGTRAGGEVVADF
jgi:prepilin-type processing-associated H-X9-DG protein